MARKLWLLFIELNNNEFWTFYCSLNFFDRTKFASTSVVQVALLKTCQIQCPVPPESLFLGVPLPSALQQTLFVSFSRFSDPKTRGSVMKSLQNLIWHSPLFETSGSTVTYICGYHNQNDFHGFLVSSFQFSRNALALSQALSTDKITIIDFQMTYNRLKLSGRINVLPDLFPRRKWSDQKYRRLTDHCDTAACEYSDSWNCFFLAFHSYFWYFCLAPLKWL